MLSEQWPAGEAAVMFTDIEGSVRHWETAGHEFARVLEQHNRLVHECVVSNGGTEAAFTGDGFLFVFPDACAAVRAGVQVQDALRQAQWPPEIGPLRARVAIHLGDTVPLHGSVVGPALNFAARLLAAGHGGQTLVSDEAMARAEAGLLGEVQFVGLGMHRLRDIAQRQRIHLATWAGADVPAYIPLRTLDTLPTNLPAEVDEFIGRQKELEDLGRVLGDATTRLVTITGPGGVGKTRLLTRLGLLRLDQYPDGVWLVELADITEPAAIAPAIANALRMPHLAATEDPVGALAHFLSTRSCLLLLDNYEQVVEGAGVTHQLLRAAAGLACVTTSRERLRVAGEFIYELGTLELPQRDGSPAGEPSQSVRLFMARAAQARGGHPLADEDIGTVERICCMLDGLPLALELAAAQLAQMSMVELMECLERSPVDLAAGGAGTPLRHQSVAAAIEWSRTMLDSEERAVFDCLGVLRGGFFAAAAQAVSQVPGTESALRRLRDKSLLQTTTVSGRTRYLMLPLVREYCAQHGEVPMVALRERAAGFFIARAAEAQVGTRVSDTQWALAELDNLRAALLWTQEHGDPHALAEAVVSIWPVFNMAGAAEECARWQEVSVAVLRGLGDEAMEARALIGLAVTRKLSGHAQAALALLDRSIALSQRLNLGYCLRWARMEQGTALQWLGRREEACRSLEASLAEFRETGEGRWAAECLRSLARLARDSGDLPLSITRLQEAMDLEAAETQVWGVSSTLHELGQALMAAGDYAAAVSALKRSIELGRQVGDQPGLVLRLVAYAKACAHRGDEAEASAACEEALTLARRNAPHMVPSVYEAQAECAGHR